MPGLTAAEKQAWEQAKASHVSGGLSPEKKAAWANARPMGTLEDSARSGVTGFNKAVAGFVSMSPQTAIEGANAAGGWLGDRAAELFGFHPSPKAAPTPAHSALQALGGLALNKTADAATQAVGAITGHQPSPAEIARNRAAAQAAVPFQSGADANRNMRAATGPYHVPQTWQGRLAQTAGEMSGMAVLPGSAPARVARVLIPTVTSDAAGELTHGTKYEQVARTVGGLAGGLLEGGLEATANAPSRVLAESAGNLTPQQAAMVEQLRTNAAQQGIDLPLSEAVQQVTGGGTGMGRLQRLLESAKPTSTRMAGYFAERPGQVQGAVDRFVGDLAPNLPAEPGITALDAQRAAEGAQIAANSARSQASKPFYQAADAETVDPAAMADIVGKVRAQAAADQTGLIAPKLQALADSLTGPKGAPILDQGNLSTARNFWRDAIDNPPVGSDPLTRYQAGLIKEHLDNLDALLKASPNRQLGDAAYADVSRNVVDPLNAGPVGSISKASSLDPMVDASFPANPFPGQARATRNAFDAMGAQNPDVPANLTASHIGQQMGRVAYDSAGRPNQFSGAALIKALGPGGEKADTLAAALTSADPSGETASRFDDLANILKATGWRERPGSMTAFNIEDQNLARQAPGLVKFLGAAGDPLEWTKNLSNWTGGRLYNRNLNVLADMLTNPDTAAVLQRAQAAASPTAGLPVALLPAALAAGSQ